jgi:hypothetical protein
MLNLWPFSRPELRRYKGAPPEVRFGAAAFMHRFGSCLSEPGSSADEGVCPKRPNYPPIGGWANRVSAC